jgi:hypothetical protein
MSFLGTSLIHVSGNLTGNLLAGKSQRIICHMGVRLRATAVGVFQELPENISHVRSFTTQL